MLLALPLPRPYVAPGDRRVSPSLRTLRAGLLLSLRRGSDCDDSLSAHGVHRERRPTATPGRR